MSEDKTPEIGDAPEMPKSSKLIIALVTIAMVSGLLVALTFQVTAPRIAENKQKALEKAIFTVLPDASRHINFKLQDGELTQLSGEEFSHANVFAGYDDADQLVGLALEGSARGYQDLVKVLFSYSLKSQCITGITVLQSSETPGIGDKVESDLAFLKNFECLDAQLNETGAALANAIVTVKNGRKTQAWEIDGISGATITSTAVGNALNSGAASMLPDIMKQQSMLHIQKGAE